MRLLTPVTVLTLAAGLIAACAGGSESPATTTGAAQQAPTLRVATEGERAPYLVGPDGRALYVFTEDTPGASRCSGSCAAAWPPLTVEAGVTPVVEGASGEVAVIEREDGSRQVTYRGAPLYYYAVDSGPGQTNGHEVGGVWFLATPDGASAASGTSGSGGSDGYDEYGY